MITALGQVWHVEHFVCAVCKKELSSMGFFERDGQPYCNDDYHKLFSPRCAYCKGPILKVREHQMMKETLSPHQTNVTFWNTSNALVGPKNSNIYFIRFVKFYPHNDPQKNLGCFFFLESPHMFC